MGLLFLPGNDGGVPCLGERAVRTTNMCLQHQTSVGDRLNQFNPCHTYSLRGRNRSSLSGKKPIKREPLKDLSKSWLAVALDKTAFPGRMSRRRKGVPTKSYQTGSVSLTGFPNTMASSIMDEEDLHRVRK